jgi:hypothetical protein
MEKHAFIRHQSFGKVECTGNCGCLHMLLCATPRFASTRFIRLPLVRLLPSDQCRSAILP